MQEAAAILGPQNRIQGRCVRIQLGAQSFKSGKKFMILLSNQQPIRANIIILKSEGQFTLFVIPHWLS